MDRELVELGLDGEPDALLVDEDAGVIVDTRAAGVHEPAIDPDGEQMAASSSSFAVENERSTNWASASRATQ